MLHDRVTGATWRNASARQSFPAASTVKLAMVADLLVRERRGSFRLAPADQPLIDAALRESKRVVRLRPGNPRAFLLCGIIWAAAAAALEKVDEARTAVEHCLAQRPDLRANGVRLQFARDEDHTRLVALLRKAGLP